MSFLLIHVSKSELKIGVVFYFLFVLLACIKIPAEHPFGVNMTASPQRSYGTSETLMCS